MSSSLIMLKNKKFLRVFLFTVAWFVMVILICAFILPAGIYSCRDAAFMHNIPSSQIEGYIDNCQAKQLAGTTVMFINFLPAIIVGFIVNQLALAILSPVLPEIGVTIGNWLFLIPFGLVTLVQIVFVSKWLYHWLDGRSGNHSVGLGVINDRS